MGLSVFLIVAVSLCTAFLGRRIHIFTPTPRAQARTNINFFISYGLPHPSPTSPIQGPRRFWKHRAET